MSDADVLPRELVDAFLRLCEGDFSHRLPRTMSRDAPDTVAFFFNTIAEELERVLLASREQEQRLSRSVELLSDALTRVAAGDFSVQVERSFDGDALDVLAYLVNQTISEIGALTAAAARRAEEERQHLEELVAERTQQLRASEENFRRLLELAPAPILLIDRHEARVVFGNERAAAMLGLRRDDLVGQPALELLANPHDRQTFLERLQREGAVEGFAAPLQSPGRGELWSLISARVLDREAGRTVMVSFADLTEQKQIEGHLRELATTDALTGVMNRRRFLEVAAEELARAERYGRPVCLAMLDIDHFKAINDGHGHDAGDRALRLVARTLHAQLRQQDCLGRYGGEEFAVLLPETSLAEARDALERSRAAIGDLDFRYREAPVSLAVSVGVVARAAGESLEAALRRADEALYAAKSGGRNRVVAA